LIYSTTKHFLEVFDLKDLKDLPTPKEIEELGKSATDKTDGDFFNDTKSTDQDKGNNT
jgi:segregation and condensation protein B